MATQKRIAIVGGGPAGLRAAEVCVASGARVSIFDAKRSVGRKLLVAGYGGLNLTHGEASEDFIRRYSGGTGFPVEVFASIIRDFPPAALRDWAAALGIETFEQRTGRIYPREMKAAPLLRRWIERLRRQGVAFHLNQRLTGLWHPRSNRTPIQLFFNDDPSQHFDAVLLALGGASWPITGSDGHWTSLLESHGVCVTPFEPANCGWEADWPDDLVPHLEGQPLKNIAASAGPLTVRGELMLTRYGLEGGAIYQLGPTLRAMPEPSIEIDLKPAVPREILTRKMESVRKDFLDAAGVRLKLPSHALHLLRHFCGTFDSTKSMVDAVKSLRVPLVRPRPIKEAISTAGGIAWTELDDSLQLRRMPGVFACGEMIDWEAPTGGYLIQACFATATRAARKAAGGGCL